MSTDASRICALRRASAWKRFPPNSQEFHGMERRLRENAFLQVRILFFEGYKKVLPNFSASLFNQRHVNKFAAGDSFRILSCHTAVHQVRVFRRGARGSTRKVHHGGADE